MSVTFERLKELLEVEHLQGTPEQIKKMLGSTDALIVEYGEKWITQNRNRLLCEWEFVIDNM